MKKIQRRQNQDGDGKNRSGSGSSSPKCDQKLKRDDEDSGIKDEFIIKKYICIFHTCVILPRQNTVHYTPCLHIFSPHPDSSTQNEPNNNSMSGLPSGLSENQYSNQLRPYEVNDSQGRPREYSSINGRGRTI